jgi:hypothetical protein
MKSEESRLLNDVLTEGRDVRSESLRAGLSALRGRRIRRRVFYATSLILLPLVITNVVLNRNVQPQSAPTVARAERKIPGTEIRVLTDDELLDFFKGRPVALIGPPGDQRLIVFGETVANHSRTE